MIRVDHELGGVELRGAVFRYRLTPEDADELAARLVAAAADARRLRATGAGEALELDLTTTTDHDHGATS